MHGKQDRWIKHSLVLGGVVLAVALAYCCLAGWTSGVFFNLVKAVPVLGLFLEYVAPPGDYYKPLVDVAVRELPVQTNVVCRYSGRYVVCIDGIDAPDDGVPPVGIELDAVDGSGDVVLHGRKDAVQPLSRGDGRGYNYHYFYFHVPDEVPRGDTVVFRLSPYGCRREFLRRYPTSRLKVVKMFDK